MWLKFLKSNFFENDTISSMICEMDGETSCMSFNGKTGRWKRRRMVRTHSGSMKTFRRQEESVGAMLSSPTTASILLSTLHFLGRTIPQIKQTTLELISSIGIVHLRGSANFNPRSVPADKDPCGYETPPTSWMTVTFSTVFNWFV